MRPPILWITVAFGAGLASGLDLFAVRGAWYVVASVTEAALWLARRAPLGAAMGIMGAAGMLWGGAALRERAATCEGRWTARESRWTAGAGGWMGGGGGARAAMGRLGGPGPGGGGVVGGGGVARSCGGGVWVRLARGVPPPRGGARGGAGGG